MIEIIRKHSHKSLWLFIVIYIIFFSIVTLKKYYAFGYNAFDLAIFNQVFFNTLAGRYFEMTVNIGNFLAYHFEPIIFLLLPIYKLWPKAETLLILQNIIFGLSAWPLYKIASHVSKDALVALIAALIWLINPFVHNANLYEFHILPLAIFFVFWTFYFYQIKAFKRFCLFFLLALLVREDMSLVLIAFSLISFLDKRGKKWIISPLFCLLYFALALQVVSKFDQDGLYKFLIYYSWLGGYDLWTVLISWFSHPIQFLGHLFSLENFYHLFILFITVGFLPLFSPKYLWLSFLPILEFALTSSKISPVVYAAHYALLFLAGFFIAIIFSLNKIKKQEKFCFSKYVYKEKKLAIYFFVAAILYFSFVFSPVRYMLVQKYDQANIKLKQEFIYQIPKEASLMISSGLDANLSSRQTIYTLQHSYFARTQFFIRDFNLPELDYILIDMDDMFNVLALVKGKEKEFDMNPSQTNPPLNTYQDMSKNFRNRFDNYDLIKAKNNLLLWQNKKLNKAQEILPLYQVTVKPSNLLRTDFVVEENYLKQDKYNILKITYQKTQPENFDYLLRFYGDNNHFDLPLDYGLWPLKDWSEDSLMSFYYYLSKDIKSYQIFSWTGEGKLGNMRDVALDKEIIAVTEQIYLNE
ncbi:MAG: DUF2079 domain-containing protein [Patescibacteria group bacterium]